MMHGFHETRTDMISCMAQIYNDQTPTEGRQWIQDLFQDVTILDRNLSWD